MPIILYSINLIYVIVADAKLELKRNLYYVLKPHMYSQTPKPCPLIAIEWEEAKVMSLWTVGIIEKKSAYSFFET